jgi:nicotinamidase-related amidase
MAIPRIELGSAALLVIDVQQRLLPVMHNAAAVEAQAVRLIRGCRLMGLPIVVTEQYPKGLGPTTAPVTEALAGGATLIAEKMRFSALVPSVIESLAKHRVTTVLVCGIEAHVCVLQTCLDLMDRGIVPVLVHDAIGSRRPDDQAAAVARLTQAGVVPTTVESALLEMVQEAGTERFKAMLPIIK